MALSFIVAMEDDSQELRDPITQLKADNERLRQEQDGSSASRLPILCHLLPLLFPVSL